MLIGRLFNLRVNFAFAFAFALFASAVSATAGNHVVVWGSNTFEITNVPSSATNVVAIAAGYGFSLALKTDGTVVAWGVGGATNVPAGLNNVEAIASGDGQCLALKSDGTLVAWGAPRTTATTNVPAGLSNILAIACGDDHNLVLRGDGTIYAWGANYSSQTNIPADLTNVVAIAAGNSSNLAIKQDGTAWGSRTPITNQVAGVSNIVSGALVAGGYQGAILLGDGDAQAWGYPNAVSTTNVPNSIAAVGYSPFNQAGSLLVLRRDGTLTLLNGSVLTNNYMGLSNVLAIAMSTQMLAIVGDSLPGPTESIESAGFLGGQFAVSQPTSIGHSYWLEYKDFLIDNWQSLPPVPGNGSIQVLSDPAPPPTHRFYQVRIGR